MFLPTQSSSDRLRVWRESRQQDFQSEQDLVNEFSNVKVLPRYIDYYTPRDWPSPFEIVNEGYFCKSGLTLVMTATLIHKGFITSEDLTFLVISNNLDGTDGLVLLDGEKVYNFTQGKIDTKQFVLENGVVFTQHTIPKNHICT